MKKLMVLCAGVFVVGCSTIPLFDSSGNIVLDPETGMAVTETVLDPAKIAEGASTVGMLLPSPWNAVLPLLGSLAVVLRKKD